jgi:cytochrome c oxidase assembly protein subunit 11
MAIKINSWKLGTKLALLSVAMLGFSYAMVPLYKSACDAGLINPQREDASNPYANVNRNVDTSNTQVDKSRWITVEFIANTNEKMPWNFAAQQKSVKIHPGEMTNVVYDVVNTTDKEIVGVAVPSYGPALAVEYFKKVECFCFTKQTMAPHEHRGMPVVFVVTPDLPKDVSTITLSYTFFEVKG